jgi:cadmium resistance protein CadD (predicted permease)
MKKEQSLRADMFLPGWILGFGIVLEAAAIGCIVGALITHEFLLLIGTVLCALLGTAAIMCWNNQKINIIDDTTFEYTTFLGKKKTYFFTEIKSVRQNADSLTLFVGSDKVHIESCAILSERLADKFNSALGFVNDEEQNTD